MTWRKTIATRRDITDVVAQIVEHFHPQQVVLFGSYAHGTPTPDSDVDLLVVMETPLRNVEQAVEIHKREVLTKGVVLYAANDTEMGR